MGLSGLHHTKGSGRFERLSLIPWQRYYLVSTRIDVKASVIIQLSHWLIRIYALAIKSNGMHCPLHPSSQPFSLSNLQGKALGTERTSIAR